MSARQYGKLPIARWREDNWTGLDVDAQWLHNHLASQSTTDGAGVFPIQITKWAKGASDMTVERVKAAAKQLADRNWIIVDHDTEEGLLRTYIGDDQAGDNIFKGQLNCALQAQSPKLRAALLREIRQLGRQFKDGELERIDALEASIPGECLSKPTTTTAPTPSTATTTQPFDPPPNAVQTPSGHRSNGVPLCANGCDRPGRGVDPQPQICEACYREAEVRR